MRNAADAVDFDIAIAARGRAATRARLLDTMNDPNSNFFQQVVVLLSELL